MKQFMKVLFCLFILAGVGSAQVNQTGTCDPTVTTCSVSNQQVGNVPSTATATNSTSSAAQSGNSADANGATVSPTINNNPQQEMSQGSATQSNNGGNTSGTVSGGNNSASTSANGNQSSNDNHSSVGNTSTGASTATNGPNTNSTGASTSNSSATTGNNQNTNQGGTTSSKNTNVSAGGAGGTGGQSSSSGVNKSANTNLQGQTTTQSGVNKGGNTTSSTGGNTQTGGAVKGGNNGGNSTNSASAQNASTQSGSTVDTSNHSVNTDNSKVLFIPAVVPESAPTVLGVGQIVVSSSKCGPLQAVEHDAVSGITLGYFKQGRVDLGTTDRLVPYFVGGVRVQFDKLPREDGVEGYTLYGHQVTMISAILGVGAGKNIAVGGGAGNGSWGQGGAGQSSSMQRLVTTVQLTYCKFGDVQIQHLPTSTFFDNGITGPSSWLQVTPAIPPPPQIIYREVPAKPVKQ